MKRIILISLIGVSFPVAQAKKYKKEPPMYKTFNGNIIDMAIQNDNFRREVVTGPHSQVVLMSLKPGEDIGEEVHKVDQTLIFVQGRGQAILNGKSSDVSDGSLVFVPAGTKHNFRNTGDKSLKLYTIYAPAQHKPGTVEKEKTAEY